MAGATLDEVKQLVLAQQAMIARMDSESRQNRVVVNRLEAHMVQERKQKLTEQAAKDAAEAAAAKTARPPKRGSLDTHGASTKRLKTSGALDLSAPYNTRADTHLSDILRKNQGRLALALLEPSLQFLADKGQPMSDDHILEAAISLHSMIADGHGELCHSARRNRAPLTHPATLRRGS